MERGAHAGWVYKQGRLVRNWKKRFMVLRGASLAYYDTDRVGPHVREKGSLQADSAELSGDIRNGLLVRSAKGRVLKLYTDSAEDTEGWFHAIMDAVQRGSGSDDSQAQHSGWLEKQGERGRNWERRWFTLHGDELSYFESARARSDARICGRVRAVEVSKERQSALDIRFDDGRIMCVAALTPESLRKWLLVLTSAIKTARDEGEEAVQNPTDGLDFGGTTAGPQLPPSSTGSIYDPTGLLPPSSTGSIYDPTGLLPPSSTGSIYDPTGPLPPSSTGSIYDPTGLLPPSSTGSIYDPTGLLPPSSTGSVDVAFGPNDGFQAANTSTGLWSEPALLSKRIPSDQLTVTKPLSSGEFGDVWLGALLDGTQVAVKQLKQDQQTAANALVFATEIVRMTQLSHAKISAFVGVEWTKQWETRAVVEYLPRGDLRTFLGSAFSSPLQQPETEILGLGWADFKCQMAIDVADALAYLHSGANAGMVSFTSRNVLLEGDYGRCKLSVFAAARRSGNVWSNQHYLEWAAPEILLGEADTERGKAAVYSLGVLLCELDTMKPPFFDAINPNGSAMPSAKIAQLVSRQGLRPSVSRDCPEGIVSLVSECLAWDPRARPSATSVAYRLRELLKNEL